MAVGKEIKNQIKKMKTKKVTTLLFLGVFFFYQIAHAQSTVTESNTVANDTLPISNISKQTISVVSPGNGEIFTAGDKVVVNWTTSGISEESTVHIMLTMYPKDRESINKPYTCVGGTWDDCIKMKKAGLRFLPSMHVVTKNTGSAVFPLPKDHLPEGRYYFYMEYIEEIKESNGSVSLNITSSDASRFKLFSIRAPKQKTSVVEEKKIITENNPVTQEIQVQNDVDKLESEKTATTNQKYNEQPKEEIRKKGFGNFVNRLINRLKFW